MMQRPPSFLGHGKQMAMDLGKVKLFGTEHDFSKLLAQVIGGLAVLAIFGLITAFFFPTGEDSESKKSPAKQNVEVNVNVDPHVNVSVNLDDTPAQSQELKSGQLDKDIRKMNVETKSIADEIDQRIEDRRRNQ